MTRNIKINTEELDLSFPNAFLGYDVGMCPQKTGHIKTICLMCPSAKNYGILEWVN